MIEYHKYLPPVKFSDLNNYLTIISKPIKINGLNRIQSFKKAICNHILFANIANWRNGYKRSNHSIFAIFKKIVLQTIQLFPLVLTTSFVGFYNTFFYFESQNKSLFHVYLRLYPLSKVQQSS